MSLDIVRSNINASLKIKQQLLNDLELMDLIVNLANKCIDTLRVGGKIIFCGNGGSFADAQHLSAEFSSRFLFDRPSLPSIALGTNSSTLTAIANDYGYDKVFSREIESIANPLDIMIAITTSGKSANIIKALQSAKRKNIYSVVFAGAEKGKISNDTTTLHVPSNNTARVQECHILIGHILCEIVESSIFKRR